MRFFAEEIREKYRNGASRTLEERELWCQWEDILRNYAKYLKEIERKLPRQFSEIFCPYHSFYDAHIDITAFDRVVKPGIGMANVKIEVIHPETNAEYSLIYDTVRKFEIKYDDIEGSTGIENNFQFAEWIYDEIELLENGWVRHEIVLLYGAEILIEFKDFSYTSVVPDESKVDSNCNNIFRRFLHFCKCTFSKN